MRNSKIKLLASIAIFIFFVCLITWVVVYPFDRIYSSSNDFDVVIVGASESQWGIDPRVIKEETGLNTCVLSTSACKLNQRYDVLASHIKDKSLKLVILELSKFSLTNDMNSMSIEERVLSFTRVNGLWNKVNIAVNKFSLFENEYDVLFSQMLSEGINAWDTVFKNTYDELFSLHGYEMQENHSQLLTPEEARDTYRSEYLATEINDENAQALLNIIELCKENGVPLMIITMPLSEKYLWQYGGWDTARVGFLELISDKEVTYYDFNLLKNRQEYFSDVTSYRDEEHLCAEGAEAFSNILSKTIEGFFNDESYFEFYDWYGDAIASSVYAQYR